MITDWVCKACFDQTNFGYTREVKTIPNFMNEPCHYCGKRGDYLTVNIPDHLSPADQFDELALKAARESVAMIEEWRPKS